MRASPLTMALLYFSLAFILIFFAIYHVSNAGWDLWSYLIIAFATTDVVIGIRFLRFHMKIDDMNDH